jgi:hypothetical protein
MSAPVNPSARFMDMNVAGKALFFVKLCAFFASFGFAFPTLLSD